MQMKSKRKKQSPTSPYAYLDPMCAHIATRIPVLKDVWELRVDESLFLLAIFAHRKRYYHEAPWNNIAAE